METAAGRFARLPSCKNMIAETIAVDKTVIAAPESMRAARRWILWRPGKLKKGKREKKPVFPYNATQPETWMTFERALREAEIQSAFLGFVLGDGFIGFDLDNCIIDGALSEGAIDLLRLGTYVEESPSKEGLHAIACATIPRSHKDPGFEVYDGAPGHARWFAFTGNRVGDVREVDFGPELQARVDAFYSKWFAKRAKPKPEPKAEAPETYSDAEVIELLRSFQNGAKFQDLWSGGLGDSKTDSEADVAFLEMARFVTRDNRAQLDRLFRQSGRMRDKWNEKRGSTTYGEQTITKALSYVCEYYNPRTPGDMRGQISNWWALRIKGYGESPFRVLMYLAAHADENGVCFPSRKTGAKELGIHVDTWDDGIYTLKAFGILRKSQRYNSSILYTLRYARTPGEPIELPDSKKPLRIKERKSEKSISRRVFSQRVFS